MPYLQQSLFPVSNGLSSLQCRVFVICGLSMRCILLFLEITRADWASAMLRSRPNIHARPPHMTLPTSPPYRLAAARCNHLGGLLPIECRMPLRGNFRRDSCKIIISNKHSTPRAVWAPLFSCCAQSNAHWERMPAVTVPPHHHGAARRNLFWSLSSVPLRIPLA